MAGRRRFAASPQPSPGGRQRGAPPGRPTRGWRWRRRLSTGRSGTRWTPVLSLISRRGFLARHRRRRRSRLSPGAAEEVAVADHRCARPPAVSNPAVGAGIPGRAAACLHECRIGRWARGSAGVLEYGEACGFFQFPRSACSRRPPACVFAADLYPAGIVGATRCFRLASREYIRGVNTPRRGVPCREELVGSRTNITYSCASSLKTRTSLREA